MNSALDACNGAGPRGVPKITMSGHVLKDVNVESNGGVANGVAYSRNRNTLATFRTLYEAIPLIVRFLAKQNKHSRQHIRPKT